MSLFPAYGGASKPPPAGKEAKTEDTTQAAAASAAAAAFAGESSTEGWKNNTSFAVGSQVIADEKPGTHSSPPDSSSEDEESSIEGSSPRPPEQRETPAIALRRLEFDASDGFYVDKKNNPSYLTVKSLARLSRPRYIPKLRRLRDVSQPFQGFGQHRKVDWKRCRYGKHVEKESKVTPEELDAVRTELNECRVLVAREPQRLEHWIRQHQLLGRNPDRANRLAVSEQQLHALKLALEQHTSNEEILQLYIETASATYPASQVALLIEQLLERNPFEYTLWTALIMATQGTMARCNANDVLRIYENSMRRMHLGHTDDSKRFDSLDTDPIMLKLFHNCALFLRQMGHSNRMFAMLKMALEMNVMGLEADCLVAQAERERPLIDFEEVVLESGMPLPEIWTRVELLRQAYCYLPYPTLGANSSASDENIDAERLVFSADVCSYVYPLKSACNRLHLCLLIVQVTKVPVVRSHCLAERLCTRIKQIGESEAVEMLLAVLADRHTYIASARHAGNFSLALLNLAREMSVTPSFMPHFLGSDLYEETVCGLLLKCSEAFAHEENSRRIFILLWFRFKRLLLVIRKLMKKLNAEYLKEARQRIRQLLRQEENRQVARFFTELAMFEYEALDGDSDPAPAFNVFRHVVAWQRSSAERLVQPDLMHAYATYAEMLIARNQRQEALELLTCVCLQQHAPLSEEQAADTSAALQHSEGLVQAELELLDAAPPTMALEEFFAANKLLLGLRCHCLVLCLLGRANEADQLLHALLKARFGAARVLSSERHRFLREQLLELHTVLLQVPGSSSSSSRQLVQLLERGLEEFPRNMALLGRWATVDKLPWYKQRARFIRTKGGILSVLHLVLAARCRYVLSLEEHAAGVEAVVGQHITFQLAARNRVIHVFETFLPTNVQRSEIEAEQYQILRRNSLYWRCYLRCLSDKYTSFDRSKEVLLTALDECPWDKALYMDGAMYVPQELGHLQDVMIEKQLRIYAMIEELDILRDSQHA
ncbi:nuclear exosome regulator NRDE2 [Drosophila guanche]|uniref:Blast:Protein NRDE2 homolog n=1 Tax=Drosophila guanche TaxID=7266 RepID=A0A3B0J8X0_DROGU|nr:nuclear exosome regulator NRDE2 [Drosophila guanche]XP_034124485.1 nuclear exosome regulator NRDE2 [Drosophila guanche]SPP78694.1 blast:Protein NRDE2 homolog [Drosophila guanche]